MVAGRKTFSRRLHAAAGQYRGKRARAGAPDLAGPAGGGTRARGEQSSGGGNAGDLSAYLNWVAATLASTSLIDQIDDGLGRIVGLVAAVRDYSYMDRTPEEDVDIHAGIEKTLLVLGHKMRPGIEIERDYDPSL